MSETLATLAARVSSIIQDVAGYIGTAAGGDRERAIREALETYDADAPRVAVADIAGDGATYDLPPPAGYLDGFSRVLAVEYPAGARDLNLLTDDDWSYYRTAGATVLRLASLTPAVGETVRVTYTAPHALDGLDGATATTIPAHHAGAVANLAAARCLLRLADRFLHEQEDTLNMDSVDRGGKSDQARRLAGALTAAYREAVGVASGNAPALAIIDLDASFAGVPAIGGLTHDRRRR